MRFRNFTYFFLIVLFVVTACRKGPAVSSNANNNIYSNADVYVSGVNSAGLATYWKNGMPNYLSGNEANAITVNGGDVYVAGSSIDANYGTMATYWKNGVATNLPGTGGIAFGIEVYNGDVYVVGMTNGSGHVVATYWKNGVIINLIGTSAFASRANAVLINGLDVYIAGCTSDANGNYIPTYWKNGSPVYLLGRTSFSGGSSIAVKGTDVYVAGSLTTNSLENTRAVYWKNGVISRLPDTTVYSRASNIIIKDSDIYIAGYTEDVNGLFIPTYWKNGIATKLPLFLSGFSVDSNNAIAVIGNDIYVSGIVGDYAGFWKNGIPIRLDQNNNSSVATGIAVVPR